VAGKAGKTKAKPMVGWLAGGGKMAGKWRGGYKSKQPELGVLY